MSRARQVANFDPALFAADEVSGDKVSGGTIGAGTIGGSTVVNTSGAITTTGAFTSVGIDDNADANAITINSSENVGIGTTAPSGSDWNASMKVLHMYQNTTNGAGIKLESSNTKVILASGNDQLQFGTISADPVKFHTGATERMQIDTAGNVGIGAVSYTHLRAH